MPAGNLVAELLEETHDLAADQSSSNPSFMLESGRNVGFLGAAGREFSRTRALCEGPGRHRPGRLHTGVLRRNRTPSASLRRWRLRYVASSGPRMALAIPATPILSGRQGCVGAERATDLVVYHKQLGGPSCAFDDPGNSS